VITAVARHRSLRLLIGGDGPERAKLERQVEQLGMGDRIQFLGWVEPEEVLDHCDILASAARIEGHPMALLDARRRGLPIVAVDVGGVSAIVADGRTGILVPPGDITALSSAIGRLAANPDLRIAMASAAAERARRSFSPHAMASAYCRLYAGAQAGAIDPSRWNRRVAV
ncbi:MAG: glycosyltransferase, partial [Acidimicrobiia bacterium]|nr:glycosyltransferase [Acidimicrobiia bacterium]